MSASAIAGVPLASLSSLTDSEQHVTLRKDYEEHLAALAEAESLVAQNPEDDEAVEYVREIQNVLAQQVEALATLEAAWLGVLSQEQDVNTVVAPVSAGNAAESTDVRPIHVLRTGALFEVHYDGQAWYAAALLGVLPAGRPVDRRKIRVAVLGYRDVEEIYAESLRRWQPPSDPPISARLKCHAIDPQSGVFRPCVVDRISPNGTAVVSWADGGGAAEVFLSHIRTGRVYRALIKKERHLTDEERKARNVERKRQRNEEKLQATRELVAKESDAWQDMLSSVMPGAPQKVRRI